MLSLTLTSTCIVEVLDEVCEVCDVWTPTQPNTHLCVQLILWLHSTISQTTVSGMCCVHKGLQFSFAYTPVNHVRCEVEGECEYTLILKHTKQWREGR